MERPRDSKITIQLGMRGEDIVTLPPLGINGPDVLRILFVGAWLVGLLAAGAAVASHAFPPSPAPREKALPIVWLALWGLGVLLALWVLTRLLTGMLGRHHLVFDYDRFVISTSFLGFTSRRALQVDLVGPFTLLETPEDVHALKQPIAAIAFQYRGKTAFIAYPLKREELQWLPAELNRLLEQHRRR